MEIVQSNKQPIKLHGFLFENMMVLLQNQNDERYLLKHFSCQSSFTDNTKEKEIKFNPITKIHLLLVRQSAVNKKSFFLINTSLSQMLEISAQSQAGCKE